MNTALILLAAGSSSRLGHSKQLLKIGNETLLEHSIKTALQATSKVFVVLGANANELRQPLNQLPLEIIENKSWSAGMGGSIKSGLKKIMESDETFDCVIIMVCDQPMITSENIKNLLSRFQETKSPIVASSYNNTIGVPALFDSSLFDELLSLDDQFGAKKIIQNHLNKVERVDCPEGTIDIDTLDDYQIFLTGITGK